MSDKRCNPSIPEMILNLTQQKPVLLLETMSQFAESVIPDELLFAGQDPWFDRLTTLSEVEGESSVG